MKDVILAKSQRMARISQLLYRHPSGLGTVQLAQLCGVTRRTIQRDLADLQEIGIPIWEQGHPPRYGISEGYYLPPLRLTLDEALALFLAARLLARYADSFDPHITQALAALATVLPDALARHVQQTIGALCAQPGNPRLVDVLSVLALGWATGRRVRIWHQALGSQHVHEYLLAPYFMEPSAAGYATYVIGWSSYFDDVHTFKVERIQRAELTGETFEVPAGFNGALLLRQAWGIMYGDGLQDVVLRFAASASRRIHESCWHPGQQLEDLPDGGCILRLRIAHPEEMTYWIRGWGSQVEVLEPTAMLQELADEARRVAKQYAVA